MPDVTIEVGTQIRFFVTGSFSPFVAGTNWTIGTPTDVVLTLAPGAVGLANGAGRQSDKIALGTNRAPAYDVFGAVDATGETPAATGRFDYYWLPSTSTTQGTGNVAGNSGADGAAPDGALGSVTLAEFAKMGIPIGSLFMHDGAVVQNGFVESFSPPSAFGQLLVINNSGDALEADDVENHQVLNPRIPDVAAS